MIIGRIKSSSILIIFFVLFISFFYLLVAFFYLLFSSMYSIQRYEAFYTVTFYTMLTPNTQYYISFLFFATAGISNYHICKCRLKSAGRWDFLDFFIKIWSIRPKTQYILYAKWDYSLRFGLYIAIHIKKVHESTIYWTFFATTI